MPSSTLVSGIVRVVANKTKAALDTCQADLENALEDISRVIDDRDDLKMELDSVSANSRELQAELETSKKSIEELTIKLEKLKAECQRPSSLSVLQTQPQKVRDFPMNLPGPSSVLPAVRRKALDLN
ncbi:hypothetical protein DdX_14547 [Ditylenchus destructor]|uniref:Uncharacterized protein n=1 Tax=Ditylenchus destructor TaxID=166010 RepID=A0AAD4MUH4_9BILA|nr:hypothetical protein DdX_14547 [Ditylenchus destructor]